MFIDHIGAGILEQSDFFMGNYWEIDFLVRGIGRIAFPIFCYLITQGCAYTHSRVKYALNLFIFALISEIPYDLLFWCTPVDWGHQNVYLTLLIGLLSIWLMDIVEKRELKFGILLEIPILAIGAILAELLETDYGAWGVLLIGIIFLSKKTKKIQCITSVIFIITSPFYMNMSLLEAFGAIAFIFIGISTSERKNKINKYVFYALYPIHLLIYSGIRYLIFTYI